MAKLPEIASLWIGGRLSWLEQLCLKSFADAGHHITLYSYSPIDNIPNGVHAADAEEIFPSEPMLRHARTGSPAIHADMWRLQLLKKTDKIWVDADMYCYRPFNFSRKSVFGWEKEGLVCNAVLGLPKTSKTLKGLLDFFKDEYAIAPWLKPWQQRELEAAKQAGNPVHMTKQDWGFTGPASVTWFLEQTGEIKYAEPQSAFYPISFKHRNHMIKSKFEIESRLSPDTVGIHFWARRMKPRLEEKEGNIPERGSFMRGLIEKHDIDPLAAPIPPKKKPAIAPKPAPTPQSAVEARPIVKRKVGSTLEYSELIEILGVKIPFDPSIITPKIERPMRNGRYEAGEVTTIQRIIRPGDRVLEIGSGVGLVSAAASKCKGVESITTVEANPDLIPLIEETFRVNDVQTVTLKNAVVSNSGSQNIDFFLRADFWASSMEPDSRPYIDKKSVRNIQISDLMKEVDPTIISCDIEGAELGLFDEVNLDNVREIVLEVHPKVYGDEGVRNIVDVMASKGFRASPDNRAGGSVKLFERIGPATTKPQEQLMPVRAFQPWLPQQPKVLIVTCMKDEGPFILEWIAWHQALGITDFLVYSNDCSDGTDLILDRLAELGIVTHLPNPAQATDAADLQPVALNYSHYLKEYRDADFVISMDVDEFINVRVGQGLLSDLFTAVGDFDVLSMSEINHGCNKTMAYEPGWVKDQFPFHQSETPGQRKSRRGVKSITRMSPRVDRIRNHRPDMNDNNGAVRWLDGSGRDLQSLRQDSTENGVDVRGTYDLVSLDHFALRSLESYLLKMFRGDVVVKGKQVSQRYWRQRNQNESDHSSFARLDSAARVAYEKLIADPVLKKLHEHACQAHTSRIHELLNDPHYQERKAWILENAWDQ